MRDDTKNGCIADYTRWGQLQEPEMRREGRHAQAVRELTVIVVHWPLAGYVSTRLFPTRSDSGSCLLEIRYRKILAKILRISSENKGKKAKEKNIKKCTKFKNIWLCGNLNSLPKNLPYVDS